MKRRRSSTSVTLVLISASALTACGQQVPPGASTMRRDTYTSQADCAKEAQDKTFILLILLIPSIDVKQPTPRTLRQDLQDAQDKTFILLILLILFILSIDVK